VPRSKQVVDYLVVEEEQEVVCKTRACSERARAQPAEQSRLCLVGIAAAAGAGVCLGVGVKTSSRPSLSEEGRAVLVQRAGACSGASTTALRAWRRAQMAWRQVPVAVMVEEDCSATLGQQMVARFWAAAVVVVVVQMVLVAEVGCLEGLVSQESHSRLEVEDCSAPGAGWSRVLLVGM
jgi:hypothetical protein